MSKLINGQNIMPKTLFLAVVKNHRTTEELALHYSCSEEDIMKIAKRGLEHKAFDQFVKANDNNKARSKTKTGKTIPTSSNIIVTEVTEEENKMAHSKTTSTVDKVLNQLANQQTELSTLINQRTELSKQIENLNALIDEDEEALKIRQNSVKEAQQLFEKAKTALSRAKEGCSELYQKIQQDNSDLSSLKEQLNKTAQEIEDLEKKAVYLVDPDYDGELPKRGIFISTAPLKKHQGVSVEIKIPSEDYSLMPSDADKLIAEMMEIGCDSVIQYGKALQFVSLIYEYTYESFEFSTLITDPFIEKLKVKHIG